MREYQRILALQIVNTSSGDEPDAPLPNQAAWNALHFLLWARTFEGYLARNGSFPVTERGIRRLFLAEFRMDDSGLARSRMEWFMQPHILSYVEAAYGNVCKSLGQSTRSD
jgi:hypothetical protein